MANKLTSKPKMIDLSKDRNYQIVNRTMREINTNFLSQLHDCNIPGFKVMEKIMNVENFFMNHNDYAAIYGSNIELLDRMMLTAIANCLTKDIITGIEASKVNYPGVWDYQTIYGIAAAAITFMKHDTLPEMYFTALQFKTISQEDLNKCAETSYMQFSNYTQNQFYQVFLQIRAVVIDMIGGIIDKGIPKAFLSTRDVPLGIRLYNTYHEFMAPAMQAIDEKLGVQTKEVPARQGVKTLVRTWDEVELTSRKVGDFVNEFEKPFLSMMIALLAQGGLSENTINTMLAQSEIHILYDDPTDTATEQLRIQYSIHGNKKAMVGDNPLFDKDIGVNFTITLANAVDMGAIDPEAVTKTKKDNFGKSIRKFVLDLTMYAINVYVAIVEKTKEAPVVINEAQMDNLLDGEDTQEAPEAKE